MSSFNFTDFSDDFVDWFLTPFKVYLGDLFWPMIFTAVIGFAYVISHGDLAVTVAAVLLTFGIFGTTEAFIGNPEFTLFFSIIAVAGFAGTIMALFIKRYG